MTGARHDDDDRFLLLHFPPYNQWAMAHESLRERITKDYPEIRIVTDEPPEFLTEKVMSQMKVWGPEPIFTAATGHRELKQRLRRSKGTVVSWRNMEGWIVLDNSHVILQVVTFQVRRADKQRHTLTVGESVEVDWDPKSRTVERIYLGPDDPSRPWRGAFFLRQFGSSGH